MLNLQSSFDIQRFGVMEIIVKKIKKIVVFKIRCLKSHMPVFNIAFFFLSKVS